MWKEFNMTKFTKREILFGGLAAAAGVAAGAVGITGGVRSAYDAVAIPREEKIAEELSNEIYALRRSANSYLSHFRYNKDFSFPMTFAMQGFGTQRDNRFVGVLPRQLTEEEQDIGLSREVDIYYIDIENGDVYKGQASELTFDSDRFLEDFDYQKMESGSISKQDANALSQAYGEYMERRVTVADKYLELQQKAKDFFAEKNIFGKQDNQRYGMHDAITGNHRFDIEAIEQTAWNEFKAEENSWRPVITTIDFDAKVNQMVPAIARKNTLRP
jgi:hypothetical protein